MTQPLRSMDLGLQHGLKSLIQGQDNDSVNEHFGTAMCEPGEYAKINLMDGTCEIRNEETDDIVMHGKFTIRIGIWGVDPNDPPGMAIAPEGGWPQPTN